MSLAGALGDHSASPNNSEITAIVFVVERDLSVRKSLEFLIRSQGWDGESFGSAEAFLVRTRVKVPSCLILDVALPGPNVLELQKRIAREHSETPIIFISSRKDISTTVQAIKAGAVEFLTKPFNHEALLVAIRESLELSRRALDRELELRELHSRYALLTSRERQVMARVVGGVLNKQTAIELGISEITVKAHRGRVMQKMKASSLPHLVRMAERLDLEHFIIPVKSPSGSRSNGHAKSAELVSETVSQRAYGIRMVESANRVTLPVIRMDIRRFRARAASDRGFSSRSHSKITGSLHKEKNGEQRS